MWYLPLDAGSVQTIEQAIAGFLNRSLNVIVAKKTAHLELILRLSSKSKETTSHNSGIWRGMFQLIGVSVLSDAVVAFYSQFLDCATVGFSE